MELRTYVGKGVSTVSASVERVDTERVRVRLKKGTATSATLIAPSAEAEALLTELGALLAPPTAAEAPASTPWAWDARSASIDPVLSASRVTVQRGVPVGALAGTHAARPMRTTDGWF